MRPDNGPGDGGPDGVVWSPTPSEYDELERLDAESSMDNEVSRRVDNGRRAEGRLLTEWERVEYVPGMSGPWPPRYMGEGHAEYHRELTRWEAGSWSLNEYTIRRRITDRIRKALREGRLVTTPPSLRSGEVGDQTPSTGSGTVVSGDDCTNSEEE